MKHSYVMHDIKSVSLDTGIELSDDAYDHVYSNPNIKYIGLQSHGPHPEMSSNGPTDAAYQSLRTMLEVQTCFTGNVVPELNASIISPMDGAVGGLVVPIVDKLVANGIICNPEGGAEYAFVKVVPISKLYTSFIEAEIFPTVCEDLTRVRTGFGFPTTPTEVTLVAWLGSVSLLTKEHFDTQEISRQLNVVTSEDKLITTHSTLSELPFKELMEIMFSLQPGGCRRLVELALLYHHVLNGIFGKFNVFYLCHEQPGAGHQGRSTDVYNDPGRRGFMGGPDNFPSAMQSNVGMGSRSFQPGVPPVGNRSTSLPQTNPITPQAPDLQRWARRHG